jgi:hypothetical protein
LRGVAPAWGSVIVRLDQESPEFYTAALFYQLVVTGVRVATLAGMLALLPGLERTPHDAD